ncbi:MAG: CpsD/CapB family tyrosine-protein kinase [Coriobacteriales bacterium]|jgi:capsular exopolysaccharide synthesis family protein|nr:CpsD/CapB family tyrosine-protein kinase [Coriobacteriales bacterium]
MARRRKKQLNSFEHPQLFNASKTLLANIRFSSIDKPIKTIVVTSSAANEGKTIVATNLAYAIATSGKRVLIVEADMHYRSLNRLLDLHPTHGIYAALSETVPLDQVILSTRIPNLYFMDAEPNIPSPSDILGTKRCTELIAQLHEMFDYVIFDTPPLFLFVDAAVLSNIADGTLFVVRQNQTKRTLATKCMQQLQVANAHVLGLVTTFCEGDDIQYYYAYYTQDGKRVDKKALKRTGLATEVADGASAEVSAEASAEQPAVESVQPTEPTPPKPNKSPKRTKTIKVAVEPAPKVEAALESKLEPEAELEAEAKAKPKAKPKAKSKAQPKAKPKAQRAAEPEAETETKPEAKTRTKTGTKAKTKAEAKPEAVAEAEPEAKPETKPEVKSTTPEPSTEKKRAKGSAIYLPKLFRKNPPKHRKD